MKSIDTASDRKRCRLDENRRADHQIPIEFHRLIACRRANVRGTFTGDERDG